MSGMTAMSGMSGLSGIFGSSTAAPAPASSLLTDLVSYWKLDEVSGVRVDSHGTNDLLDNLTVGSQVGILGLGIDNVKADLDFLSHAHNADLDMSGDQDFTVAFWFKNEAQNTTDALVTKYTGGGTNSDQWMVYYSNALRFIVRAPDNKAVSLVSSLGGLAPGTWRLVMAWRDGVNVYLQVDDGVIDSAVWIKDTKDNAVDFRVGRFGAASYSNSGADELGLWKRVLTPSERTEYWNGGIGVTYPF